ncbi:acyl-ACP--UDP-N-acetylglucosamine O-acyltransferase [Membranihabitans marinus]|uniref:acyl-ACP--UDP-N-acetylglucosamine O-acyltransferase n=1 Tax=Membranihabitans marinus TaxID=1227546 RepID=UPI001F01D414|nr:acyl-ACP--UDP-N-acetylglucosamine O-acyltransferase [Membranihabitans marinus]
MIVNDNAFIHPAAKLGSNVKVEPFTTIAGDVEVGEGTWIGPHVTIMDGVRIGKNCKIFPGAVLGAIPQDLKYKGENTMLILGDNVIIREYCTLNKGTSANTSTTIGNNCLLMAYVHVAHDCVLENNCILANNVNLAGHIHLEEYVQLGGLTAVHQFVKVGKHSFVGGGSLVRKDVPPFIKAAREPLAFAGVNTIGLRRRGFSSDDVLLIEDLYRTLFVKGNNVRQGVDKIMRDAPDSPFKTIILDFIEKSNRGLIRGYKSR